MIFWLFLCFFFCGGVGGGVGLLLFNFIFLTSFFYLFLTSNNLFYHLHLAYCVYLLLSSYYMVN